MGNGAGNQYPFNHIERIEILKGPTNSPGVWSPTTNSRSRCSAYIFYKQGLKSAEFNPAVHLFPSYWPGILDAYELSLKSQFFDNRVQLNLAVFYFDYRDYQQAGYPGIGTQLAYNADLAEVYGFEARLDIAITDKFTISRAITVLDREIVWFDGMARTSLQDGTSPQIDPSGNPLSIAADFVGKISATYDVSTDSSEFAATVPSWTMTVIWPTFPIGGSHGFLSVTC